MKALTLSILLVLSTSVVAQQTRAQQQLWNTTSDLNARMHQQSVEIHQQQQTWALQEQNRILREMQHQQRQRSAAGVVGGGVGVGVDPGYHTLPRPSEYFQYRLPQQGVKR